MNWSDLVVLGIIVAFGIIGLMNGFIYSIFRLASYFVSVIVSIKFYPFISGILLKTSVYTGIKASILKNLLLQKTTLAPTVDGQAKQAAAGAVVDKLALPGFMKGLLAKGMPNPSKLVDVSQVMDMISSQLAKVVIDVIALVILYILVRVALIFARFILRGIAKLPVFKQVDKLGGFALGAVEGLLTIYIICTILLLFNASPQFNHIFDAINGSTVAKFFYYNNFIVNWMFPGKVL
jgi:uncharacterized membrane protein required for colicin V production